MTANRPMFAAAWNRFIEVNVSVEKPGNLLGGKVESNEMKKFLIITLLVSPVAFAIVPPKMDSFTQPQIFQNWLQNRCVGKITQDESLKDDAFKSASAWLEVSHLPVDAFNDGGRLIDEYLKINFTGSAKADFKVLKCSLLSNSEEQKSIYSKYSK
ncbi:T6SS amidase immunity protein Tai4 family protein [Erwinia papayae]|uniref:T6SS amidase immunity protein Tai4 family protein n=1 Tax=Erwinia papayae TaxID=206499 RepID=A0ABV3N4P3_9GAMM